MKEEKTTTFTVRQQWINFATPQPFQKGNKKHLGWALQDGHLMPNGGQYQGWRIKSMGTKRSLHCQGHLVSFRSQWEANGKGGGIWIREDDNWASSPAQTTGARSAGRQHLQLPYILNGTDEGHRWPLLSIKCRALREESHTVVIKQTEEGEGLRRVAYNLGPQFSHL